MAHRDSLDETTGTTNPSDSSGPPPYKEAENSGSGTPTCSGTPQQCSPTHTGSPTEFITSPVHDGVLGTCGITAAEANIVPQENGRVGAKKKRSALLCHQSRSHSGEEPPTSHDSKLANKINVKPTQDNSLKSHENHTRSHETHMRIRCSQSQRDHGGQIHCQVPGGTLVYSKVLLGSGSRLENNSRENIKGECSRHARDQT